MMSAASGSLGGAGPVFGGGFGRGRSGLDSQPPAKMMRMDDSGQFMIMMMMMIIIIIIN